MNTSHNKSIVRRLYDETFNRQDASVIESLVAADVVIHDPMMGELHGLDAFRQFTMTFLLAFPKQHTTIEACIAEDDLVAVLHTHTGTHIGPFLGLPATGREINVRGIEFFRIQNDKIVELWRQDDDAGLMRQLGLLPAQMGEAASV